MEPDASSAKALAETFHGHLSDLAGSPFVKALGRGELPARGYVGFLRAMAVVHGVLETIFRRAGPGGIGAAWEEGLAALPLLEADLRRVDPRNEGGVARAEAVALRITSLLRLHSVQAPPTLLGHLATLRHPRLAEILPAQGVASSLGAEGSEALAYARSLEVDLPNAWESLLSRMEELISDPEAGQQALDGAREACEGLQEILDSLHPLSEEEGGRVSAVNLNPEAGHHPVPADRRELAAAIEAGRRCWETFPYFRVRYGNRGARFTNSDGAWLVTLAGQPRTVVEGQVNWLSRLLAARGMPRITMEVYLTQLSEELTKAVPERADAYRDLLEAARTLESARFKEIPRERQEAIVGDFEGRVAGMSWARKLPGAGLLLVSAAADEAGGVDGAVESLEGWLTDSDRFPEPWAEAVRITLGRAREAAATSHGTESR